MKITGSYQLIDNGVSLEGVVHDTHIAEMRKKFVAFQSPYLSLLHPGWIVSVPVGERRSKLLTVNGKWFLHLDALNVLDSRNLFAKYSGMEHKISTPDAMVNLRRMGIGVVTGDDQVFCTRKVMWNDPNTWRRVGQTVNITNVAWVFDKVKEDGSFEVQLDGLLNRHMVSSMLARATIWAKILDSQEVRAAYKDDKNVRPSSNGDY